MSTQSNLSGTMILPPMDDIVELQYLIEELIQEMGDFQGEVTKLEKNISAWKDLVKENEMLLERCEVLPTRESVIADTRRMREEMVAWQITINDDIAFIHKLRKTIIQFISQMDTYALWIEAVRNNCLRSNIPVAALDATYGSLLNWIKQLPRDLEM